MKIEIAITNILGVIIEVLLFNRVFSLVSDGFEFKKKWVNLSNAVLIIAISASNLLIITPIERSMMMYILLYSISILYKCSGVKKVMYTIMLVIAMLLCEVLMGMLMSLIFNKSIEQTQQNIFFYFLGAVVSKMVLFVIILFLKNKRISNVRINMTPFMILPLVTGILIYTLGELYYSLAANSLDDVAFLGIVALCVCNILFFYLFEKQVKEQSRINEQIIINNALMSQTIQMEGLLDKYKISNKVLHDLDNKIITLKGLMNADNAEANKSITELTELLETTKQTPFTGLNGVDALLNSKIEEMNNKKIKLIQSLYLEKNLKIKEIDLCILLGNLIDNAIEAVESVDVNKYISIEISSKRGNLFVVIENSTIQKKVNDKTTKEDNYKHGYGNHIVKEIVANYNGNIVRTCENGIYKVVVMV